MSLWLEQKQTVFHRSGTTTRCPKVVLTESIWILSAWLVLSLTGLESHYLFQRDCCAVHDDARWNTFDRQNLHSRYKDSLALPLHPQRKQSKDRSLAASESPFGKILGRHETEVLNYSKDKNISIKLSQLMSESYNESPQDAPNQFAWLHVFTHSIIPCYVGV